MLKTTQLMISINKSMKRKPYDAKKSLAVKATAAHFKCSESWVRLCVSGTAKYGNSDDVKKFYTQKYSEISSAYKN